MDSSRQIRLISTTLLLLLLLLLDDENCKLQEAIMSDISLNADSVDVVVFAVAVALCEVYRPGERGPLLHIHDVARALAQVGLS